MLERALDVEALPVGLRERPGRDEIDRHADERDEQHRLAADVRRRDEPPAGLEHDQQREHQQRDPVRLRREDLDAPEAVGHDALGGPCREPDRDDREADRGGVGQHVRGVGEQRERPGDEADDDLEAHEADDQREREREFVHVGVGGDSVRVSCVHSVAVCVAALRHRMDGS